MNNIKNTLSICHHCYKHVSATRFERDGSIWLTKTCPEHGESTHLVEPDAEFYNNYVYRRHALQSYFIEITNRCNLTCPHCYQMPDNKSTDPAIDTMLNKIQSWPDDGYPVALVGAEPTVRQDLPEIIDRIHTLSGKKRTVMVLTNGVNMHKEDYARKFEGIDNLMWTIGLNHTDYQGPVVRRKQMQGIENMMKYNLPIKNISYTLLNLTQLEDCIDELIGFDNKYCSQFRIRCGVDIGRSPEDNEQVFLSDLLNATEEICKSKGYTFEREPESGNRAHYPVRINGLATKIIQWPSAETLDLSEVQTEAIADILPRQPPSPLVHQVLLRDGAINKRLPLLDTIPKEWIDNYGK